MVLVFGSRVRKIRLIARVQIQRSSRPKRIFSMLIETTRCSGMQTHRGAESSRLLVNNMTGMFIVRLGFAAIMMFPVPTLGFSVGQAAVVKMSLWGIGMAKSVYTQAVQAIGPDAMVVAQPMIPGTETIVLGLIQNELC